MITDYSVFFEFLKKYQSTGFQGIDREDPFMKELEEKLKMSKQFFFAGDIIQIKIKFTSKGSLDILGIEPDQVDPASFYTGTHPDELTRHNLARTKLFKLGQEIYITKQERILLSTNFQLRHTSGSYSNVLVQCYLFYTEIPYRTVFLLQVCTDISNFKGLKFGYHYYIGTDMVNFRYPDEKLLKTGHVFSRREFEIIQFMASGLNSTQIAAKLFLSVHTINTHRRNIIRKTQNENTHELILDLKERGVI